MVASLYSSASERCRLSATPLSNKLLVVERKEQWPTFGISTQICQFDSALVDQETSFVTIGQRVLANLLRIQYNSTLREGNVTHREYMQVGKGRDVGLNQISLFEAKIANRNGDQTLSHGIYLLGHRFDLFRMLSCYYTTIGFYFNTMPYTRHHNSRRQMAVYSASQPCPVAMGFAFAAGNTDGPGVLIQTMRCQDFFETLVLRSFSEFTWKQD